MPHVPSAPVVPEVERRNTSRVSALAPAQTERLIASLAQDLTVGNESFEHVLQAYQRTITDHDRRRDAENTLREAAKGRLKDEADLAKLTEVLYFSGRQPLLSKHHVLFPAYRVQDDYFLNATGPSGPLTPKRPQVSGRTWMLLGKRIGFPFGVPASPLTANAQWVHYLARNGFNVLTYKTVRSRAQEPHTPPNWIFLPHVVEPFPIGNDLPMLTAKPNEWVELGGSRISTANSFGVPSAEPRFWESDLEESFNVLHDHQVLIVSVMGDDYDLTGESGVIADDYASLATRAERAGADLVELNLSCPNSLVPGEGVKPPLCQDVNLTKYIVDTVRDRIDQDTRLIAKLSYLPMTDLRDLVTAIGESIDAISGINTLQSRVVDSETGQPVFPDRHLAGISGISIRDYALDFTANLTRLRLETGFRFEIIGMGGVTDVNSFKQLYDSGAVAVQSASGAFSNPFLAWECVDALGESLPLTPELSDPSLKEEAKAAVLELISDGRLLDRYVLASKLSIPPSQTLQLLDELFGADESREVTTEA